MTADAFPQPMRPRAHRVHKVKKETSDTFTIELAPEPGEFMGAFLPGQFNMLYVHGTGEVPISISGDPALPQNLVHTTRIVGPVTRGIGALQRGDQIGIRGPFGTPWPVTEAVGNDVVIVAGGIGLAPLRPALYRILDERKKYGRVVLLYGARTPEDLLFRDELRRWRAEFDLEIHVTVDRTTRDWRGNVGVVTTLIPRVPFDPYHTVAMVCGPEVMMRFTVMELERRGVPSRRVFVSMERNMKCGIGLCGHCQFGPQFVCRNGPVFSYDQVHDLLNVREV